MDAELRVDIRKWVEGRMINNHRWSERLYSLQIEAPIEEFQAGQFGRLGLVIDEELVGRGPIPSSTPRMSGRSSFIS